MAMIIIKEKKKNLEEKKQTRPYALITLLLSSRYYGFFVSSWLRPPPFIHVAIPYISKLLLHVFFFMGCLQFPTCDSRHFFLCKLVAFLLIKVAAFLSHVGPFFLLQHWA